MCASVSVCVCLGSVCVVMGGREEKGGEVSVVSKVM